MGALIVNYRSLLELVGGEVGESGELGWRSAVCASFEAKGLGKSLGHVCCLWGMLSIAAPCWSWWGGEVGEWGCAVSGWRCVRGSFGTKGLVMERPWGRGWSDFICYLCGIVIYQLLEDTHQ